MLDNIEPRAIEEIGKIRYSEKIHVGLWTERDIVLKAEYVDVSVWKPYSEKMVKVSINWHALGSVPIEDAKEFHEDMQEIIKIAEQIKEILIKYGQYKDEK